MNLRLAFLVISLGALPLSAQSKPKPAVAAEERGYRTMDMSGFKVHISEKVDSEEKKHSTLNVKPLEAIRQELETVANVIKDPKKLQNLRTVPVYVEWNEERKMGNGRGGNALAVYRGGHQSRIFDEVREGAVTVLNTEALTGEHQPGDESGRCVLLHELAHAYHDKFAPQDIKDEIRASYLAAMEAGKAYDPSLYVATNEYEYFAELTCSYLQGLDYPPRNPAELKEHDLRGFKLMAKAWGPLRNQPTPTGGPDLPSADGGGRYKLNLRLARVKLGEPVVGTLPDKANWKGRPVLAIHFPADDETSLYLLRRVSAEADSMLRDFGLLSFGADTSKTDAKVLKEKAWQRDITFPLVSEANFGGGYRPPHAIVFDHNGTSIFRGHPLDAVKYARIAVGWAILARTGKADADFSEAAKPVVERLNNGAPMEDVFKKIGSNPKDSDLQDLLKILIGDGEKALKAVREKANDKKATPTELVAAYNEAERLKKAFTGSSLADQANSVMRYLFEHYPKVERVQSL